MHTTSYSGFLTIILQVVFVGNDVVDIDCIKEAGIGVAVKDARPEVLKEADYVTKKKGGFGAVREIADLILGEKLRELTVRD
jgi:3-deoxy-D-manno-octulosonate 8-phosphate phosphatase (KDO 8-P phosphatase)